MRESFCGDCSDHEACSQNAPCAYVKQAAESAIGKYIDINGKHYRLVDEFREVVLDPDNDEDLSRLLRAFSTASRVDAQGFGRSGLARMENALRSLLPKPKPVIPPEPEGVRAVIDADGHTHLRLGTPGALHQPWTDGLGNWRAWEELAHPVTILRPEQPTGDER